MRINISKFGWLFGLINLLYTLTSSVTISPCSIMQSDVVILHGPSTTPLDKSPTLFNITYTKSHTLNPTSFYFLNHYKMQDKFIYENFISFVNHQGTDKWIISVQPISSTNLLALSISYIAVQNTYLNFFVKQYTVASQAVLTSGGGARTYVSPVYNFNTQTNGTLSTNSSQNKILISLTGFYHVTSKDVDIYLNVYLMNTTAYQFTVATTVNDYWYRVNVQVCIFNLGAFPTSIKYTMGTIVLSVSNTIKEFIQFDSFSNVSYCFGYSGINANTADSLDIYWTELNSTTIQIHLSLLNYAHYSYLVFWNESIPVDPTPPTPPTPPEPTTVPVPNLQTSQPSSSPPIGIIIGAVIGIIAIAGISIIAYKFYFQKRNRMPIKQNQKQYNVFTPSFV